METQPERKKASTLWLIVRWALIGLVILCATPVAAWQVTQINRNRLAVGEWATLPPTDIGIAGPVELDFLSRQEVYRLRTEAVMQYPGLVSGRYKPSPGVFRQVEDGLPWWGMIGQHYYGSGEKSIEGPSEEARFILNPYALVSADFYDLSFYGTTNFAWNDSIISPSWLYDPRFPFTCEPRALRWWPEEARAEIVYDLSGCLREMNRWLVYPLSYTDADFDLIAFNARDFNLNYLYVAYDQSQNLYKPGAPANAFHINHYLHRGASCGYPGGCNNMSPDTPEISQIEITGLPARAIIRLWRSRPGSVEGAPDFVYVIHIE